MKIDSYVLWAILLGGLVTWLTRVFPFVLTKYKALPDIILRFLHYLPVTIIFALTLSSLFVEKAGTLPQVKWLDVVAVLPTFWVAIRYQNILGSVLTGVVCVALLRFVFG